jgi:prepilin-type N-terminal cleavage/methylation domain-containing protein
MTARRSSRAGMTLVEILVAVTLLGMLSLGLVTALQTGVGAWQDSQEAMSLDRRIANMNNVLHSELAGLVPILAEPARSGSSVPPFPFFQGEPTAMRFVSSYSLAAGVRSGLRIVELMVIPGDKGQRLILNELPYQGPRSVGAFALNVVDDRASISGRRIVFGPIKARANSLIVADQLGLCRFSYLRYPPNVDAPGEWVPVWDDPRKVPVAVRLEMAAVNDEARLQPVTITAQVRSEYGVPNDETAQRFMQAIGGMWAPVYQGAASERGRR